MTSRDQRTPGRQSKVRRKDSNPQLGADVQNRIGGQLRAMYDDIVKQGVPDRFAELVRQIEASPPKRKE